jgi:hypothetical protein
VTGRPTAECAAGPVGQGRLRRRSALALRPPWTALTSLNDGLAIGRPGNLWRPGDLDARSSSPCPRRSRRHLPPGPLRDVWGGELADRRQGPSHRWATSDVGSISGRMIDTACWLGFCRLCAQQSVCFPVGTARVRCIHPVSGDELLAVPPVLHHSFLEPRRREVHMVADDDLQFRGQFLNHIVDQPE